MFLPDTYTLMQNQCYKNYYMFSNYKHNTKNPTANILVNNTFFIQGNLAWFTITNR